jgi:hypothetical protein
MSLARRRGSVKDSLQLRALTFKRGCEAVRVEQCQDGSLAVKLRGHDLSITECQPRPKAPETARPRPPTATSEKARPKPERTWIKDFNLQSSHRCGPS